VSPSISKFRQDGQLFFRAQYYFGARIISRLFITELGAQRWLSERTSRQLNADIFRVDKVGDVHK
jgi:hypothetical protein